jgi:hypothetical protein
LREVVVPAFWTVTVPPLRGLPELSKNWTVGIKTAIAIHAAFK